MRSITPAPECTTNHFRHSTRRRSGREKPARPKGRADIPAMTRVAPISGTMRLLRRPAPRPPTPGATVGMTGNGARGTLTSPASARSATAPGQSTGSGAPRGEEADPGELTTQPSRETHNAQPGRQPWRTPHAGSTKKEKPRKPELSGLQIRNHPTTKGNVCRRPWKGDL